MSDCPKCAALEGEVARLEQERNRASEPHAALMGGWLSRNDGAVLSDNPHPAGTMKGDWWEKGWQWRDDALASDSARALLRELVKAAHVITDDRYVDEWGKAQIDDDDLVALEIVLSRVEAEAMENADG